MNVKPYFCTPINNFTMATNRTFTMLKPDATAAGNTGKIIDRMIEAGFAIKAMKWTQLSKTQAEAFYSVHAERPFYGELVEYMTSGPVVAMILERRTLWLHSESLSERPIQLKLHQERFAQILLKVFLRTLFTGLILTTTH